VRERYEYDPYGNLSIFEADFTPRTTSNYNVHYTYTCREWTPVAGLYYFRNRWYDSQLGRFSSRDPIGYEGRDQNLYGYVGERPMATLDPTGMWPWDAACTPGEIRVDSTAVNITSSTWPNPTDLDEAFATIEDINDYKNILAILASIPAGPVAVMVAAIQKELPTVSIEIIKAVVELKKRASINFSGAKVYTKVTFSTCEERCGILGDYTTWVESTTEYEACTIGKGLKTSSGGLIYGSYKDALEISGDCAEAHADSIAAGP